MKKRMIALIFAMVFLVIVCTAGFLYMQKRTYTFTAPAAEDLKSVSLHDGDRTEEITDVTQLQDLLNAVIKDGRTTKKESMQDSPINKEKVIRLVFNYKANTTSVTYIYQDNNQFYLEQPYNGIYRISANEYDAILATFSSFR